MDKFSFESLRLLKSHFELNTNFKTQKNEPVEISCRINILHRKKDKTVNVTISVDSANEKQPFIFNVVVMGIFKFSKLPEKMDLQKIVRINCASIIFPYVREMIADLTRRASIAPFHMDPVNFVALYEEKKAESSLNKKTIRQNSAKE